MVSVLDRALTHVLQDHLATLRQMAFVTGPRQIGKTTVCRAFASPGAYFNWDDSDHRRAINAGPAEIARLVGADQLRAEKPVVVFDELHRFRRWKGFVKGLFDTWGESMHIIVTGSSRLDVYRRGGDSLMGRYMLYRMHPLTVAELIDPRPGDALIRAPISIDEARYERLRVRGGYPEPFVQDDDRFSTRWLALRTQQLVREDVRDLTGIRELDQLEVLVHLLSERSGSALSYSSLANEVQASVDTIRRWVLSLCSLHHGFLVRPWHKNVERSLRKEPKWYLSDWSAVADPGARAETFVAGHMKRAVETWTDRGLGKFELHYLRDKEKREVDFLVTRDKKPWFLVEAKLADTDLSPSLTYFQAATGAKHAFQAVVEMPFVDADCFARGKPTVVPARTLFAQLA
jgi:predicted AAA+ superfamily ATPase